MRTNNEALLCMLERERQHSQQLTQKLQQTEADALEVSSCFVSGYLSCNMDVMLEPYNVMVYGIQILGSKAAVDMLGGNLCTRTCLPCVSSSIGSKTASDRLAWRQLIASVCTKLLVFEACLDAF